MPVTIVSPLVHSPDEYDVAFLPTNDSLQKITAIQERLTAILGDAIWISPPQVLHSTLMEIICDADYTGLTRQQHFDAWYERYNNVAKETIGRFSPIDAHFVKLYASPAAIILTAADPTPFNTIRAALVAHAPLPAETKTPPEISHITIARYNQAVDLDEVREKIKSIPVDFVEHVSEFKLMKDLGPDFHPIELQTYPLGE